MKTVITIAGAVFALSACDTVTGDGTLPLLGGYRDPADQCVRIGENAFTNQFLDDSADLVGCPADYEGLGLFVFETEASQVGEAGGYRLFTVPRG